MLFFEQESGWLMMIIHSELLEVVVLCYVELKRKDFFDNQYHIIFYDTPHCKFQNVFYHLK